MLHLMRSYRSSLAIVLGAMLVETLMSLAAPWALKVVLGNVVGKHLPRWLNVLLPTVLGGDGKTHIALLPGVGLVAIAAIGVLYYVDRYISESVAQAVTHDLRMRTYHHLQRLSLSYYDKHRIAASLSAFVNLRHRYHSELCLVRDASNRR